MAACSEGYPLVCSATADCKIREGIELSSAQSGSIAAGEKVTVLARALDVKGNVRVQCEAGGWATLIGNAAAGNKRMLEIDSDQTSTLPPSSKQVVLAVSAKETKVRAGPELASEHVKTLSCGQTVLGVAKRVDAKGNIRVQLGADGGGWVSWVGGLYAPKPLVVFEERVPTDKLSPDELLALAAKTHRAGKTREALDALRAAEEMCDGDAQASVLALRSQVCLDTRDWRGCGEACERSLAVSSNQPQLVLRLGQSLLMRGLWEAAASRVRALIPSCTRTDSSDTKADTLITLCENMIGAEYALKDGQCADAFACFSDVEESLSTEFGNAALGENVHLTLCIAESALGMRNFAYTLNKTLAVIKTQPSNAHAFYCRGRALYSSDNLDQALKHLQEALRLDPDHAGARKFLKMIRGLDREITAAREAVKTRDFEGSCPHFEKAIDFLKVDTAQAVTRCGLMGELATAHLRLKAYDKCIAQCKEALEVNPTSAHYCTWASALQAQSRHNDALQVLAKAQQIDPSSDVVNNSIAKSQFEIKRAARPDLYGLFGVKSVASEKEIRAAYKQKALTCHPDRVAPELRPKAEVEFKALGEALDLLTDDFKRGLWDKGHDSESIKQRAEYEAQRQKQGGG